MQVLSDDRSGKQFNSEFTYVEGPSPPLHELCPYSSVSKCRRFSSPALRACNCIRCYGAYLSLHPVLVAPSSPSYSSLIQVPSCKYGTHRYLSYEFALLWFSQNTYMHIDWCMIHPPTSYSPVDSLTPSCEGQRDSILVFSG